MSDATSTRAAKPHTEAQAALLIARTARRLSEIGRDDDSAPFDAMSMADAAYEIIAGYRVEPDVLKLAVAILLSGRERV